MGGASSLGTAPEELAAVVESALVAPGIGPMRVPPRAAPGAPSASGVSSDDDPDEIPCHRFGHSALGTEAQDDDSEGGVDPVGTDDLAAGVCDRGAGVSGPEADVCGKGE